MNYSKITRLRPWASRLTSVRAAPINKRLASNSPFSRSFSSTSRRFNNDTQQPKQTSPHLAPYKQFGRPFAKVFLTAIFVYQVVYWTWLKLEMDESKMQKNELVAGLEAKVREMTSKPSKEQ